MGLPSLGLSGSDDRQDRRLVILILVVHATLPQEGEATLTPSIETGRDCRWGFSRPPH
jgi:hypothetical protein